MRDVRRALEELPLPLPPEADELDALRIAVAVEDACGVVLPEERITVADLADVAAVEALVAELGAQA